MSDVEVRDRKPGLDFSGRRQRDAIRRALVIGILVGALAGVAAIWLVPKNDWLQETVFLQDDTDLGEHYAQTLQNQSLNPDEIATPCRLAAVAIYGHPMDGGLSGWPPRSQQAFFAACSGIPPGD